MAITGNLPAALGSGGLRRKVSETQAAITGTGNVTTGLRSIDTGGAFVCGANSATTIPTNLATITSLTNGTVAVAVVAAAAAANTISAVAENCNVLAIGAT